MRCFDTFGDFSFRSCFCEYVCLSLPLRLSSLFAFYVSLLISNWILTFFWETAAVNKVQIKYFILHTANVIDSQLSLSLWFVLFFLTYKEREREDDIYLLFFNVFYSWGVDSFTHSYLFFLWQKAILPALRVTGGVFPRT